MEITNKELNAIQSYALFFYHLFKNNEINTFEDLEKSLFENDIFYNYMKKLASESKLDLNNYGFDVLQLVVLNYVNESVLSKKMLFRCISNIQDKENFLDKLKKDVFYVLEVLGGKNTGLNNNIGYMEDFINTQKYIAINIIVTDFDYYTRVNFQTKYNLRIMEFENRLEAYNFVKPFYLKCKEIDLSLKLLSKFLDVKMYFKEDFVLTFSKKFSKNYYSLTFDTIEHLLSFTENLYLVYSALEKINKGTNYYYVEFNDSEEFITLFERGIHPRNYDEKGILEKSKYGLYNYPQEILSQVSFKSMKEMRKHMRGIYEEIFEYFI